MPYIYRNVIFKINNVQCTISDMTPDLWTQFEVLKQLNECRATEILKYVKENNVQKFIVIDDLELTSWFETNFVRTKRPDEGIKQVGIKEKIIKLIKEIQYESIRS